MPVRSPLLADCVDPRPERGVDLRRVVRYPRFYERTARTVQATGVATPKRMLALGETS